MKNKSSSTFCFLPFFAALVWFFQFIFPNKNDMQNVDPKNKNVAEYDHSYDADDKVTNGDNPVREGTEDSSILSDQAPTGDAEYTPLKEYDNHPREQEEFVDDDALNIKPED